MYIYIYIFLVNLRNRLWCGSHRSFRWWIAWIFVQRVGDVAATGQGAVDTSTNQSVATSHTPKAAKKEFFFQVQPRSSSGSKSRDRNWQLVPDFDGVDVKLSELEGQVSVSHHAATEDWQSWRGHVY